MPILDDTVRDISIDDDTPDKCGVTVQVRDLGITRRCAYMLFTAWLKSTTANNFKIKIHFWVRDEPTHATNMFKFSSAEITVTPAFDQAIQFQQFVLSPYDYFFITIEITDFNGNDPVTFKLSQCRLTTINDPLILQETGLLMGTASMTNLGWLGRNFQDAMHKFYVFDEPLTVSVTTLQGDTAEVTDQDYDHTVVYKTTPAGVTTQLASDGVAWTFIDSDTVQISTAQFYTNVNTFINPAGNRYTLVATPLPNVRPGTAIIHFTQGGVAHTITDNGAGLFVDAGHLDPGGANSIVYSTGAVDITFAAPIDVVVGEPNMDYSSYTWTIDYIGIGPSYRYSDTKQDLALKNLASHAPMQMRKGYFCGNIVDGDNRFYDASDDVLEIIEVDAWGVSDNVMTVIVDITPGAPDTAHVHLGTFPHLTQNYVRGTILEFNFGNATSGGTVWLFCGPVAAVMNLTADYAKKYFAGAFLPGTYSNVDYEYRQTFPYFKPACNSMENEDLTFVYHGGSGTYRATLTYPSTQDKDYCVLLKGDDDSIPQYVAPATTLWDFVDATTIYLLSVEYDSTKTYNFEYQTLIQADCEIDISDLTGSYNDFYLSPYVDAFIGGYPSTYEVEKTETISIDQLGRGFLKYTSNNDSGDITVRKVTPAGEEEVPNSAIQYLSDNFIVINPFYYSDDAYFIITYMSQITEIVEYGTYTLQWCYLNPVTSTYTAWADWDGSECLPHRHYKSATETAEAIDMIKLRIIFDDVTDADLVFLRSMGLTVLNSRSWDIM